MKDLTSTIDAAYAADRAFQAAINAAGFKSRWHWHIDSGRQDANVSEAYRAKVAADMAMHRAFALSRRSA